MKKNKSSGKWHFWQYPLDILHRSTILWFSGNTRESRKNANSRKQYSNRLIHVNRCLSDCVYDFVCLQSLTNRKKSTNFYFNSNIDQMHWYKCPHWQVSYLSFNMFHLIVILKVSITIGCRLDVFSTYVTKRVISIVKKIGLIQIRKCKHRRAQFPKANFE